MNPVKIGFLIAASIAGAGFASGKEIMMFFTRYEDMSFWGLGFCALLLFLFGYIGITMANDIKAASLKGFLENYFGKYSFVSDCIIVSFMFVVFSVMLCGAGELIFINTGFNYHISALLFLALVMWTTGKGSKFVQRIAIFLMGILFVSIIMLSLYINISNKSGNYIATFAILDKGQSYGNVIWEAFTYCGYNALLAMSSIVGIAFMINSRKHIFWGSLVASIIFIVPAFLMNSAMIPFVKILELKAFPFIFLLQLIDKNLGLFYSIIVFIAMTLSAMMNGYFLRKINVFLPLCGYFLVFTGFSEIISRIYPVFGIAGLMFLSVLFIRYFMIYFRSESISNDKKVRGVKI